MFINATETHRVFQGAYLCLWFPLPVPPSEPALLLHLRLGSPGLILFQPIPFSFPFQQDPS